MGTQSFSKSGDFVPVKLRWSPAEYVEVLRSIVEKVAPRMKETSVYLCVAEPDGTKVDHHLGSFEEVPQTDQPGRFLTHLAMTANGEAGERCRLLVHFSDRSWHVAVDGDRSEDLSRFWGLLADRFGLKHPPAANGRQVPEQAEGLPSLLPGKVSVFCKPRDINWPVVPELPARLAKLGFEVNKKTVMIRRYPTVTEYATLEGALKDVETKGAPRQYDISLAGSGTGTLLTIWRFIEGGSLRVDFTGSSAEEVVGNVISFLGLEPDEATAGIKSLERKCFICYRFDDDGGELAGRLSRFLELLGFGVSTGREFAPRSISEKVKARMAQQSIVFAVLTAGEDKTWIVQEALLAEISGKPLFLLKEKGYTHRGALHADHAYIPFEAPHIEATFIPVLEGLRDLGFSF